MLLSDEDLEGGREQFRLEVSELERVLFRAEDFTSLLKFLDLFEEFW
jgi:hypothetical protein